MAVERHHPDWLEAFVQYASYGEAPLHIYRWVGVSTIAGALRRKAYIDQYYFRWFPNFYVVLVARPGIISKSTAANIGMDLLRRIPGVVFGPNVVTWQALVTRLRKSQEAVEVRPGYTEMQAPITINSSEFGNLIDPNDRAGIDMLVSLWDGIDLNKETKSDADAVPNPLVNIIAATTPSWIADNIPEYMLGGGFLSRCIFVFAHKKRRFVAYPGLEVPKDIAAIAQLLVEDLGSIASLSGEFALTPGAVKWGKEWYDHLFETMNGSERLKDYITRKQTHLHKLAMVLSASRRQDMVITEKELVDADNGLKEIENGMGRVFDQVGRAPEANVADEVVTLVRENGGAIDQTDVYQHLYARFPKEADLDGIMKGLVRGGFVTIEQRESRLFLVLPKKHSARGI